ncbi:hypothetical protein [Actinoplanes sp. NPDC049265]|uniref:hypothetical protein n=1 Tax=Actinoplanes sp. NPDC049265 TaxID=3363902 RepID=UPI0037127D2B
MSRWLLGAAGFLTFLHASGVRLGRPVFRYAEVLALVALLVARHRSRPTWPAPATM